MLITFTKQLRKENQIGTCSHLSTRLLPLFFVQSVVFFQRRDECVADTKTISNPADQQEEVNFIIIINLSSAHSNGTFK